MHGASPNRRQITNDMAKTGKEKRNEAATVLEMRDMWLERKTRLEMSVKDKTAALESLLTGKDKDMFISLVNDLRDVSDEKCETRITLESVKDEFSFGNFSVIRCADCYVWKSFNYRAVVWPSYNLDMSNGGGALYSTLVELCLLAEKDRNNLLTDGEKEEKEILVMLVTMAFTMPLLMFSDASMGVDIYKYVMDRLKQSVEQASEKLKEETPEDVAKNQFMGEILKEDAEFRADKADEGKETGKE